MKCEQVQQWLNEGIRETSSHWPQVAEHLAHCPGCKRLWEAEQALRSALAAWTVPKPRPDGRARLLMAVHLREAARFHPQFWLRWVPVGVVTALVGLGLWWVLRGFEVPAKTPGASVPDLTMVIAEGLNETAVFKPPTRGLERDVSQIVIACWSEVE